MYRPVVHLKKALQKNKIVYDNEKRMQRHRVEHCLNTFIIGFVLTVFIKQISHYLWYLVY